ncbi:MAG: hypothetical protein MHMPM18_001086 [Marteilia pararefringens]
MNCNDLTNFIDSMDHNGALTTQLEGQSTPIKQSANTELTRLVRGDDHDTLVIEDPEITKIVNQPAATRDNPPNCLKCLCQICVCGKHQCHLTRNKEVKTLGINLAEQTLQSTDTEYTSTFTPNHHAAPAKLIRHSDNPALIVDHKSSSACGGNQIGFHSTYEREFKPISNAESCRMQPIVSKGNDIFPTAATRCNNGGDFDSCKIGSSYNQDYSTVPHHAAVECKRDCILPRKNNAFDSDLNTEEGIGRYLTVNGVDFTSPKHGDYAPIMKKKQGFTNTIGNRDQTELVGANSTYIDDFKAETNPSAYQRREAYRPNPKSSLQSQAEASSSAKESASSYSESYGKRQGVSSELQRTMPIRPELGFNKNLLAKYTTHQAYALSDKSTYNESFRDEPATRDRAKPIRHADHKDLIGSSGVKHLPNTSYAADFVACDANQATKTRMTRKNKNPSNTTSSVIIQDSVSSTVIPHLSVQQSQYVDHGINKPVEIVHKINDTKNLLSQKDSNMMPLNSTSTYKSDFLTNKKVACHQESLFKPVDNGNILGTSDSSTFNTSYASSFNESSSQLPSNPQNTSYKPQTNSFANISPSSANNSAKRQWWSAIESERHAVAAGTHPLLLQRCPAEPLMANASGAVNRKGHKYFS